MRAEKRMSDMEKQELLKLISKLWTVQELKRRMNKSHMTIHNWRRERGLPYIEIKGDVRSTIRFVPNEVRAWARKHGQKLNAA